jgi:hypothetical protein
MLGARTEKSLDLPHNPHRRFAASHYGAPVFVVELLPLTGARPLTFGALENLSAARGSAEPRTLLLVVKLLGFGLVFGFGIETLYALSALKVPLGASPCAAIPARRLRRAVPLRSVARIGRAFAEAGRDRQRVARGPTSPETPPICYERIVECTLGPVLKRGVPRSQAG